MRFLYATIAMFAWALLLKGFTITCGVDLSNELQVFTTAMIIAGGLAGGE